MTALEEFVTNSWTCMHHSALRIAKSALEKLILTADTSYEKLPACNGALKLQEGVKKIIIQVISCEQNFRAPITVTIRAIHASRVPTFDWIALYSG